MITEIAITDISNNPKSIRPVVKNKEVQEVKEKDFSTVLNKRKSENLNHDKKVSEVKVDSKELENADVTDMDDLVKRIVDDGNSDITKILFMLQSFMQGDLSVQDFVEKLDTEFNVETISNMSLGDNSIEDKLLSMCNTFIESQDNGTKLTKFEEVKPYILDSFASFKEDSNMEPDIKNIIANLLNEDLNSNINPSNDKQQIFTELNRVLNNEKINISPDETSDITTVIEEKNINPDSLVKKDKGIVEITHNISELKVENSEVSKSNSDELKNNLSNSNDEKILNELISGDKDTKYNKVTTFMSQLSRLEGNVEVANVDGNLIISKDNIANDVIKAVKYMEINNIKDLTVKVVPKELGEIVIKLTMESGLMRANISASNKETMNILNSNLEELNAKLNNTDIKIQNFTVDIYNGDTAFLKKEPNSSNQGSSNGKDSNTNNINLLEDEDNADNNVEEQGNVNILV